MSHFKTEVLTRPENLEGLVRLNARWVQQRWPCRERYSRKC